MTFRAKPVVKRDHKPAWETQDRRNFYLNLGFGLIVVLAVLILAIAAGGLLLQRPPRAGRQRRRRVDHQGRIHRSLPDRDAGVSTRPRPRVRTSVIAGHLTEAQGTSLQEQAIAQQREALPAITLERLIDTKLQAKLAAQEGVVATPEDLDARLAFEATTPESRHRG